MSADISEYTDLLTVTLLDIPAKGIQYRLSVSEFLGRHYFSIREWYHSYEGCFAPSNNGFTMPYSLHSSSMMYQGLKALLSEAETLDEVRTTDLTNHVMKKLQLFEQVTDKLGVSSDESLKVIDVDLEKRTLTIGIDDGTVS